MYEDNDTKGQTAEQDDEDLIACAKKRYNDSLSYFAEYHADATDDLKFLNGNQWPDNSMNERLSTGRPVVTVNRLKPIVANVVNSIAKNTPAIQIDPKGPGADIDTAEVIAGLIKDIEYNSDAQTAYSQAAFYAVAAGLGFLRVRSEYEDEETSDEQKLVIEAIYNPQSVLIDPLSTKADGSDMDWAFIVRKLSYSEYKDEFPDSKITFQAAARNSWTGLVDHDWITHDSVQVVEYFYKDCKKQKQYKLLNKSTGEFLFTDKKPADDLLFEVLGQKNIVVTSIKWCRFNGYEILDKEDFPGKFIPIIPVYGETIFYDGKLHVSGIVRDAKDPQRMTNYFRSLQAEVVTMAPKSPWVADARQIQGFEDDWTNANIGNSAVLRYNAVTENGQLLGPPMRTSLTTDIAAIMATSEAASEDLKAITGIYDPALGAESNEVSGKAILARQGQSELSNSHYYTNLIKSVRQVGNILVQLIPTYYNEARTIRIVKPNNEQELVAINQYLDDGKVHDLTAGRYEVVVQTGPSYATRRKESADAMMTLVAGQPELMPIIGDLVIGGMDWPGAKDIAARLKTQVPPEVLAATETKASPEEMGAMIGQQQKAMQELGQMHQEVIAKLQETEAELKEAQDELKLTKLKEQADERDSERDYEVKMQTIELEYHQTEVEFLLKQEELELKKQQLGIQSIRAASDVEDKIFDRTTSHLDRKHAVVVSGTVGGGTSDDIDSIEKSAVDAGVSSGVDSGVSANIDV
jgi:hypothetical protein